MDARDGRDGRGIGTPRLNGMVRMGASRGKGGSVSGQLTSTAAPVVNAEFSALAVLPDQALGPSNVPRRFQIRPDWIANQMAELGFSVRGRPAGMPDFQHGAGLAVNQENSTLAAFTQLAAGRDSVAVLVMETAVDWRDHRTPRQKATLSLATRIAPAMIDAPIIKTLRRPNRFSRRSAKIPTTRIAHTMQNIIISMFFYLP